MTRLSDERIAENRRAVDRARTELKAGDRLLVGICGNSRGVTVTMTGWSDQFPGFITTKTFDSDEIHPINVRKVNGRLTSFADPLAGVGLAA
jgi:hypothetical protein